MNLERCLIEHCAPTLASLKTASLFTCRFENLQVMRLTVALYNELLSPKGVELLELRQENGVMLLYVCRRARLQADLQKAGVAAFLRQYGYASVDVQYALDKLRSRLKSKDGFPHEIGLFLDYPLGDVQGFIENAGANCKCIGCWKVYCNECDAIRRFARFKKCREVYTRLWSAGTRSVLELTVAA